MSDDRHDDPITLNQEFRPEDLFEGGYRPVAKDKRAQSKSSKAPPKGGSGASGPRKTTEDKNRDV